VRAGRGSGGGGAAGPALVAGVSPPTAGAVEEPDAAGPEPPGAWVGLKKASHSTAETKNTMPAAISAVTRRSTMCAICGSAAPRR